MKKKRAVARTETKISLQNKGGKRADKTHAGRDAVAQRPLREVKKREPERERESCGEAMIVIIIIIIIIITRNGIKIRLRLLPVVDSIRTTARMVTVVVVLQPRSRRLLRSGARTLTAGVLARVVLVVLVEGLEWAALRRLLEVLLVLRTTTPPAVLSAVSISNLKAEA